MSVILYGAVGLFLLWCLALYGHRDRGAWKNMRDFRYAHRGLHDKNRPENSMAAFRAAAERGFGVELDVHLLKDGQVAVFHDSALKRICGVEGRIEDLTAEELKQYALCGTEETIPLLEDVLKLFVGKAPLVVEVKAVGGNHADLTHRTAEILDRFDVSYCMESFDPRVLIWLRKNRPEIVRGQLTQNFGGDSTLSVLLQVMLSNLLANCRTRPDFIAVRFRDRKRLPYRLCRRLWGVPEFNWTLTKPEELGATEAADACGIFEGFIPESSQRGDLI